MTHAARSAAVQRSCTACESSIPRTNTDRRRHARTGLCADCLRFRHDAAVLAFNEDLAMLLDLRIGWGEITRRLSQGTPQAVYRRALRAGRADLARRFAAIHECTGLGLPCPYGFDHERAVA